MKTIRFNLLSEPTNNAKLAKSAVDGYLTYGLSLAPADVSGYNTCPHASAGCSKACIFSAGRANMPKVKPARIRKTKMFFEQRDLFLKQLRWDIKAAILHADFHNMKPAFRLNVFSDIRWESYGIMQEFSGVAFYDYTKNPQRMLKFTAGELPPNYHLTFSRSESNDADVQRVMEAGGNVAVVFASVPQTWRGRQTIDGDKSDLRFLDPRGCVVGLKVKGKGKEDQTGFVL